MSHSAILRKVGGSVMVAIPPVLLDSANLSVGGQVALSVEDGKLVIAGQSKPKYSLEELLALCERTPLSEEDRAWTSSGPIGHEEI